MSKVKPFMINMIYSDKFCSIVVSDENGKPMGPLDDLPVHTLKELSAFSILCSKRIVETFNYKAEIEELTA